MKGHFPFKQKNISKLVRVGLKKTANYPLFCEKASYPDLQKQFYCHSSSFGDLDLGEKHVTYDKY